MQEYHKIDNIFVRDLVTNKLIEFDYRTEELKFLSECQWIATEKVDGTNIRIIWDDGKLTFGGKTDRADIPKDLLLRLHSLFDPKMPLFAEKFADKKVCLYGEGYGAGIQSGGNYKASKDFILFDVWIDGIWLERGNVQGVADMLGLDIVPVVMIGTLPEIVAKVKAGFNSQWGDFIAEGVVARPLVELLSRRGDRIITKIKYRDFHDNLRPQEPKG